jgi:hypothetical protein
LGVETVSCVEVIDKLFSPNNEFASCFSRQSGQAGILVGIHQSIFHTLNVLGLLNHCHHWKYNLNDCSHPENKINRLADVFRIGYSHIGNSLNTAIFENYLCCRVHIMVMLLI